MGFLPMLIFLFTLKWKLLIITVFLCAYAVPQSNCIVGLSENINFVLKVNQLLGEKYKNNTCNF